MKEIQYTTVYKTQPLWPLHNYYTATQVLRSTVKRYVVPTKSAQFAALKRGPDSSIGAALVIFSPSWVCTVEIVGLPRIGPLRGEP